MTKFAVECTWYDDPAGAYLMDAEANPPVPKLFDDPLDAAECAKWWREAHPEGDAKAVAYDESDGCAECADLICHLGRFAMCERCLRIEHPELFEPFRPEAVPAGTWVSDPGPGQWWIRTPRGDGMFSEPHRCVVTASGPTSTHQCWAESLDLTLDNAVNYFAEMLGRDGAQFAPYVEGQEPPR